MICSVEASTSFRIRRPPLDLPRPSVSQCAHSFTGSMFGSWKRWRVVETPNMSSEASTELGNGEIGTGILIGWRHCDFVGSLFNSIRSNPSGKTAKQRINDDSSRGLYLDSITYGILPAL